MNTKHLESGKVLLVFELDADNCLRAVTTFVPCLDICFIIFTLLDQCTLLKANQLSSSFIGKTQQL